MQKAFILCIVLDPIIESQFDADTWTISLSGPIVHRDDYSYTCLYNGDLASPPKYDSLFPHFSHIPSHFSH